MNVLDLQCAFEALLAAYSCLEQNQQSGFEEFIYKSFLKRSGEIQTANREVKALKSALVTYKSEPVV